MRKTSFLIGILLITAPAMAQNAKPPEIASAIQAAAPYGEGAYTYFLLSIYDATLWTDAESWSMQAPFALSLRYDINIKKADLVERSIDAMNKTTPLSAQETVEYRALLNSLYPAIREDDRLTALYIPGKNMQLYHNGELIGTTDNMLFVQRFFGIWLSDRTSVPDLRRQLLTKSQN